MPWYYKRLSVLSALVLLGPLAFPLLWKSPDFNRPWKIILTVVFTALTIAMIAGTYETSMLLMRLIKQFSNVETV